MPFEVKLTIFIVGAIFALGLLGVWFFYTPLRQRKFRRNPKEVFYKDVRKVADDGDYYLVNNVEFDMGNGNTITVSNTGSDCGLNAKSGTIKNVNIVGAGRGIGTGSSGSYAMDGDLYIDGVTVNGPTYGINIGAGNGKKVVVTDSEIYGWNSMANVDASFTNCKFGKGNTNYAVFAIYTYAISFTNCEFGAGYAFYGRASSGGTITLNNCTVGDTTVTAANFATLFDTPHDSDFDYLMNKCEIYVDGVKVN